jgi:alkylation response protein AidB-like acyl-CoA dehydrogenase
MYAFDPTSEQQMLVETVHRFAEQKLRLAFREAEERKQIPTNLVQTGWELGLLPGSIDAQYGGFGEYSALTSALYLEELGWGDVGVSLHLLTPNLAGLPLALFGTKEQKEHYLPLFCGETFPRATAAIIEPVLQFDPADLATTAEREGDGYVLNGRKTFVPLAREAELFLIYARENNLTQGFLAPYDTPGLTVGEPVKMMGAQALATYHLRLENVRVPVAGDLGARLGGTRGIRLNRMLTVSRISLGALAVGQARAAYEYALQYAKERVAFGEPIAQRQSIAFLLANMRIELEAARLMVWEAAYLFDQREDASKAAYLAKQVADKMVLEVTDGAVQVLGGHGYVRDHPVELWLRNGRGFAAWDGLVMG